MSQSKRKILLVEDDVVNYMALGMMLTLLGHKYVLAKTGKRALQLAIKNCYKLVLMDVHLPDMTGIEVTTQIRRKSESKNSMPIVALTSQQGKDVEEQCFQAGMNGFANKPISKEQLKELIKNYSNA